MNEGVAMRFPGEDQGGLAVRQTNHEVGRGTCGIDSRTGDPCNPAQVGPKALTRLLLALSLSIALGSCATSSQTITGVARAPIAASEVTIYTLAPPKFEEIAVLKASRKSVSSAGGERAIDKVIDEMKMQAAQLGANGLLLEDFSDAQSLSLGTGVGSNSYTHNGSISLGVGGAIGIIKKTGRGRAIYVSSD
jgi:hypothetical protein